MLATKFSHEEDGADVNVDDDTDDSCGSIKLCMQDKLDFFTWISDYYQ